jgi:hypothetical protein
MCVSSLSLFLSLLLLLPFVEDCLHVPFIASAQCPGVLLEGKQTTIEAAAQYYYHTQANFTAPPASST